MRLILTAMCAAVSLSACSNTSPSTPETPPTPAAIPDVSNPGGECSAKDAESFVGKAASEESGLAIQTATGAEQFQWVLEGEAVTDDFRPNRVRVMYDKAGSILVVRCG